MLVRLEGKNTKTLLINENSLTTYAVVVVAVTQINIISLLIGLELGAIYGILGTDMVKKSHVISFLADPKS